MRLVTMLIRPVAVGFALMALTTALAAPALATGWSSDQTQGQQQEGGNGGADGYGTSGNGQQGSGAWGKSGDSHGESYGTSGTRQQGSGTRGDSGDKGWGTGKSSQQRSNPQ